MADETITNKPPELVDTTVKKQSAQVTRELYVNTATGGGIEIALLEDKKLVEIQQDQLNSSFSIGDVVLARLQKVLPGLNAAFVDIGFQKNGFLHYSDLGSQIRSVQKYTNMAIAGQATGDLVNFKIEPETYKTGRIGNVFSKRDPVLVQITKEPISTKGHRLSCDISLAGRYVVLIPFKNEINISKKITSGDERKRLLRLVESIRPKNFGVIVRTVAEGKTVADLHEDIETMSKKWNEMSIALKDATSPRKVLSEMDKTSTMLRDMLNPSFNKIVVTSKEMFDDIRTYISRIAPDKESIVQLYSGKTPLFDQFDITRQIKSTFGKTVNLDSGAYLIIEHTEALHVVDVNSGHKMGNDDNMESNAMKVNMEAAEEIARQLRLRDIGGIIVIDFIDVRNPENKRVLNNAMMNFMKADKARHTILPLSKFGIMQITRQRVKPQINIVTSETCPTCNGTGLIGPSILLSDDIEKKLEHLITKQNQKKITLFVHPYLESYFKQGILFSSIQWKWRRKYGQWVTIDSSESNPINEYHFYDKTGEEIEVEAK